MSITQLYSCLSSLPGGLSSSADANKFACTAGRGDGLSKGEYLLLGLSLAALFACVPFAGPSDTILSFNPFIAIFVLLGILYFSISIVTQVLRLLFGNLAGVVVLLTVGGLSSVHLVSTTKELLRQEVESVPGRTHSEYFSGLAQEGGKEAVQYVSGLHADISTSSAPALETVMSTTPSALRMGAPPSSAASVLSDALAYVLLGMVALFLAAVLTFTLYRLAASGLRAVGRAAMTFRSKVLPGAGPESVATPSWSDPETFHTEPLTPIGEEVGSRTLPLSEVSGVPYPSDRNPPTLSEHPSVAKSHATATAATVTARGSVSHGTNSGSRLLASNPHVRLRSRSTTTPAKSVANSTLADHTSTVASEANQEFHSHTDDAEIDASEYNLDLPYPRHPLWLYGLLPFLRRRIERRFLEADQSSSSRFS